MAQIPPSLCSVLWCCPSQSAQGGEKASFYVLYPWRFSWVPLHWSPFLSGFLRALASAAALFLP